MCSGIYINEHVKVDYDFAPAMCNKQRASAVACLGQVLYEQGRAENAHTISLSISDYHRRRERDRKRREILEYDNKTHGAGGCRLGGADRKRQLHAALEQTGLLDAMRLPENIMLVAQEDGEILGYQCTYVSFDEGELTNIAVKKSARGKGVGAHLIRCLQEKAKESGVERIVLEARVTNEAAISLYQKMGFVNLGIRKNLYEHPVEDGVIMSYTAEENLC